MLVAFLSFFFDASLLHVFPFVLLAVLASRTFLGTVNVVEMHVDNEIVLLGRLSLFAVFFVSGVT